MRYYICSIGGDAREFERAAKGHWKVENNLHWQLDFTFGDDKNSSMAKTGAKNLQTMKKIVMAIINTVKASYKLSMKRMGNRKAKAFITIIRHTATIRSSAMTD